MVQDELDAEVYDLLVVLLLFTSGHWIFRLLP